MNTNDPQAPYGHCSGCTDPHSEGTHQMGTIEHPLPKEEQRAPLLSESQFNDLINAEARKHNIPSHMLTAYDGMGIAQEFYESKITSGELRVVKSVRLDENYYCTGCRRCNARTDEYSGALEDPYYKFCPGCGAKIINPDHKP